MLKWKMLVWVVAVTFFVAGRPCAAQDEDSKESGPAMALRFADLAQRTMRMEQAPSKESWQQAVALLKAARMCDPDEPRFGRLLADAQIAMQDKAGALETLKALREMHFKRGEEDQVEQIEYIDLVVERLQTVDEKLNYLRILVPNESITPVVRSAAAWRCALLLNEKKQQSEAGEMAKKALELNPLNWGALKWRYEQASASGSAGERFTAMLAMIRSNPNSADLIIEIAREMGGAGLVKESLAWYNYAGVVWGKSRQAPPLQIIIEVTSQMFMDDQVQQAAPLLDQIIARDAENYPALVLRLLMAKGGEAREVQERLRVQARNALVNEVAVVRAKMGIREATTRPVNEGSIPPPDLGGDIDRLKRLDDAELKDAYLQAVGNLGWFEIYFSGNVTEAERLLSVIKALSDPKDAQSTAFVARMEGWLFYLQGSKVGEAKVKLSAAAERDPFAALGLVRLYAIDDKAKAKAEAVKLLGKYSYGLQGAMIFHDVREMGVKVAPNERAAPMQEALSKFPKDWMRIVDTPQQFYMLRGEPMKVSVPYGEPLWVKVSIQNISDLDLTIGEDGVIKPGLWFDVQLTGLAARVMTGVAYERITERVVLRPRQMITKMVRIDQAGLSQFLNQNVGPPIAMMITMRTNPLAVAGGVLSGPGGYSQDFPRRMERSAFTMGEEALGKMATMVQSGAGRDKLRAMELLVTVGLGMKMQKDAPPEAILKGDSFIDVVAKARTDSDANVRGWAGFLYAFAAPEEQRAPNVQRMLLDEAWQARILGLAAMGGVAKDRQIQFAKEVMEKDSVQFVKDYAKAAMEKPAPKPTTQPVQN